MHRNPDVCKEKAQVERNEPQDYGCDLCGARKPIDEIHWLTSDFGACGDCYSILTDEEYELLEAVDGTEEFEKTAYQIEDRILKARGLYEV